MSDLPKVLLMDADGVLTLNDRPYSHQHAEEHSIEAEQIEPFFHGRFRQATIGKADLVELIAEHRDLWAWKGEPEALLKKWFDAENNIDQQLLGALQELRHRGAKVYLASDQEKYRAQYMREVMFPGKLDGFFISCDLGLEKKQPEFFKAVIMQLQTEMPDLDLNDVLFFDDSQSKIDSALKAGIRAELYTSRDQVETLVSSLESTG
jgi:putative hydrolase of the HAD superfamily